MFYMEINENRFKTLEKDVRDIRNFLLGDEWRKNGIKQRVERLEYKDKNREKRWWLTIGAITVIAFLLEWGEKILNLL